MEKELMKQRTMYITLPEDIPIIEPDLENPPYGKVWRRKSDGFKIYSAITLGKAYVLHGKLLDEPIDEKPEDYELVDLENEELV